MFSTLLALAAGASLITAAPIKITRGYTNPKYEPYDVYHLRYVALDCRTQHNTTFFDDCCHPLRSGENLTETRDAYCVPNATAIASASAHLASVTAPLPTSTGAANGSGADYGNGNGDSNGSDANTSDDGAAAAYTSAEPLSATAPSQGTPTPSPFVDVQNHVAQDEQQSQSSSQDSSSQPASSSTDQAPSHTSSSDQAPSPTPSSDQAQPSPSGGSNSNGGGSPSDNGDIQTGGQATFYSQTDGGGGPAGACGNVHSDSDVIVALSTHGQWYPNPNEKSPFCGRKVMIWPAGEFAGQGNTITATCADACPSCTHSGNDIDLSLGAWKAMGISQDVGVVPINWKWV